MLPSLRGLLTLREGAGLLPALLLEWGQLPCSTHSQAPRRCRDKGKPAAKRGRKAYGPPRARGEEVAGLSNGDGGGGATKRAPLLGRRGGSGCQPKIVIFLHSRRTWQGRDDEGNEASGGLGSGGDGAGNAPLSGGFGLHPERKRPG